MLLKLLHKSAQNGWTHHYTLSTDPSTSSSESDKPLTTNNNNMPSIGRPRVPYNQASARTKFEILKKATKIYNECDKNLKCQIDEISQGCSEEVLMDISCQKMSPSKVGL